MENNFLEVKGLTKHYSETTALDNVDCSFEQGKIHALLGKNGSGKSTFANIISGNATATSGNIYFQGKEVHFNDPHDARENGIAVVYQEMSLVSSLTVAENIFLGNFKTKKFLGMIDWKETELAVNRILERLGINISPKAVVSSLSIGQHQQIEIAKAIAENPKLLILDEPTSALALQEVDKLFSVMRNLTTHGVTMIYISHRLQELSQIADTVSVLRDGRFIDCLPIKGATKEKILQMMFGKVSAFDREEQSMQRTQEEVLAVKNLVREPILNDVSFSLHRGEILGIAGLMGSGRTEIMRSIYGLDPFDKGTICIQGNELETISPSVMKSLGVSYASEDRKNEGLVQGLSTHRNLIHASMKEKIAYRGFFITKKRELPFVKHQVDSLYIKLSDSDYPVSTLSGGNQQKVVLGNCLNIQPSIMLFDEPSRGIDVEAKQQIFQIIWNQKKQGISTIMVSSELEELHHVCDRILVLKHGRITEEIRPEGITVNQLYEKCMEN